MSEKPGVFRRLRNWLFGTPPVVGTTPGSVSKTVEYAPPDDDTPVVVWANGGVFTFSLIPAFRWSSASMTYQELEECAHRYHANARNTLLRKVWSTARAFPPDEIDAAESAINTVLAEEWCFEDEAGRVACRSSVRVLLDPELREHMLPSERRRLDLTGQHQIAMLHADLVEQRTQRWLEVVKNLELMEVLGPDQRQLLVPFAANLADADFAKVMHALSDRRGHVADQLASVLRDARNDHEQIGLYEFANAYDKALQSFCRQMGLTPFSWAIDASSDPSTGGNG
jgi:hypothetical protein